MASKVINKLGATTISGHPLKGKDTRREGDMEKGIRKVVVIKARGRVGRTRPRTALTSITTPPPTITTTTIKADAKLLDFG